MFTTTYPYVYVAIFQNLLIGLLLCGIALETKAQAPRFSQYEGAALLLNPAQAACFPDITLQSVYRVQQFGQLSYQTGYFTAVFPLYQQEQQDTQVGGFAISALHDMAGEAGEVKTREAYFTGAYNLLLNKYNTHKLSFGLQAGYSQTRVDFGVLYWPSQITYRGFDPGQMVSLEAYQSSFGTFKVAAGVFWMYDPGNNPYRQNTGIRLFAGFSADNLNKPLYSPVEGSMHQTPLLLKLHAGGEYTLSEQVSLMPGIYVVSHRHYTQYTLGTTLNLLQQVNNPLKPQWSELRLQFGTWYRVADAAVFLVGMGNHQFDAALSYDVSASSERAAINNQQAFELSLAYRFLKNRQPKKISTPLF